MKQKIIFKHFTNLKNNNTQIEEVQPNSSRINTKKYTYKNAIVRELKTKDTEKHLKVARGIKDILPWSNEKNRVSLTIQKGNGSQKTIE